jgi:hypothetical protein
MRCLVSKYWSGIAHEVQVLELSPTGKMMKLDPGGWEEVDQFVLVEELKAAPSDGTA